MTIRIYYADGTTVDCRNKTGWRKAPKNGVQVVIIADPDAPVRWHDLDGNPVRDRRIFTGQDEYDPFGWGVKRGSLIDTETYRTIWERACGDSLS